MTYQRIVLQICTKVGVDRSVWKTTSKIRFKFLFSRMEIKSNASIQFLDPALFPVHFVPLLQPLCVPFCCCGHHDRQRLVSGQAAPRSKL